jgi:hypothetical protein
MRYEWDSIQKVVTSRRAVTSALALRVARLAGVGMDELLARHWLSTRTCPHCGHPPEDRVEEETVVIDQAPAGGLTVLDGGKR